MLTVEERCEKVKSDSIKKSGQKEIPDHLTIC